MMTVSRWAVASITIRCLLTTIARQRKCSFSNEVSEFEAIVQETIFLELVTTKKEVTLYDSTIKKTCLTLPISCPKKWGHFISPLTEREN